MMMLSQVPNQISLQKSIIGKLLREAKLSLQLQNGFIKRHLRDDTDLYMDTAAEGRKLCTHAFGFWKVLLKGISTVDS